MRLSGIYSFNGGEEKITTQYPQLYQEVKDIIHAVDAAKTKTKVSEEKTSVGKILFSPKALNAEYARLFQELQWKKEKEYCVYQTQYYTNEHTPKPLSSRSQRPYREMDFLKEKLGVEVQFGKYAFMVYNVCAKMTIFRNLGYIDAGIEIVPIRQFAREMSTGVSYFEQFVWDLNQRGTSNIDVPVLVLGVDAEPEDRSDVDEIDDAELEAAQPEM